MEHLAGVTMEAIFDHSDVDIDNISIFQLLIPGYAMAYLVVDRGADGSGEATVVQRGRDGLLLVDDVIMANAIELVCRDPRPDMFFDHDQDISCQLAGNSHFFYFIGCFYRYAHL